MIRVNRLKAEALMLERLRQQRKPLLEALDVEFLKILEASQSTSEVVIRKQQLRDVTAKDFSVLSLPELAALDLEAALKLEPKK